MPFTPFHMGPGLVVKAILRRRFSLMVFGWSQVAIDLQPLVAIVTGRGELHGFSHTAIGATLIGLACGMTGKPLGELGLRILGLRRYGPITWQVSFISAFIGTYSHVLIDSIMHADITPMAPLTLSNPLHGLISIEALHIWCVASAAVGSAAFLLIERFAQPPAPPKA